MKTQCTIKMRSKQNVAAEIHYIPFSLNSGGCVEVSNCATSTWIIPEQWTHKTI